MLTIRTPYITESQWQKWSRMVGTIYIGCLLKNALDLSKAEAQALADSVEITPPASAETELYVEALLDTFLVPPANTIRTQDIAYYIPQPTSTLQVGFTPKFSPPFKGKHALLPAKARPAPILPHHQEEPHQEELNVPTGDFPNVAPVAINIPELHRFKEMPMVLPAPVVAPEKNETSDEEGHGQFNDKEGGNTNVRMEGSEWGASDTRDEDDNNQEKSSSGHFKKELVNSTPHNKGYDDTGDEKSNPKQPKTNSKKSLQDIERNAQAALNDDQEAQNDIQTALNDIQTAQNNAQAAQNDAQTVLNDVQTAQNNAQAAQNDAQKALNDVQTAQNNAQAAQNNAQTVLNDVQTVQNNAQAAQNDAQTVLNDVQTAQNNAQAAQNDAQTVLNDVQTAQNNAQAAQNNAQTVLNDVQTAQNNAQAAQNNAQTVLNDVQTAQNNAQAAQNDAQTVLNDVQTAQNNAQAAQNDAQTVLNDVQTVQNNAQAAQNDAQTVLNDVQTAQNNAQAAQNDAQTALNDVQTAQNNAQAAQNNAQTVLNDVQTAQNNAQAAQNDAQTVLNDVQTVQNNAQAAQNDAQTVLNDVQTAQNNAQAAQNDAQTALNDVQTAQNNAQAAQNNAQDDAFLKHLPICGLNPTVVQGILPGASSTPEQPVNSINGTCLTESHSLLIQGVLLTKQNMGSQVSVLRTIDYLNPSAYRMENAPAKNDIDSKQSIPAVDEVANKSNTLVNDADKVEVSQACSSIQNIKLEQTCPINGMHQPVEYFHYNVLPGWETLYLGLNL